MDDYLPSITPEIVKVIVRLHKHDAGHVTDVKYIFIGENTSEVKQILAKLEKGYTLNAQDDALLNSAIPYWKTKFGSLAEYQIRFINVLISDTTTTKHFILYLLDLVGVTLREDSACFLYSYPRNIYYPDLYELASYIYYKLADTHTSNIRADAIQAFCKQLYIGDISLLGEITGKQTFTLEELIANKSFQDFYKSVPYTYGPRTYFKRDMNLGAYREVYSYEAINILTNPENADIYTSGYTDQQTFISTDASRIDDILDYKNTSQANTLYLLLAKDLVRQIQQTEASKNKLFNNIKHYIIAHQITLSPRLLKDNTSSQIQKFFSSFIQTGLINNKTEDVLSRLVSTGKLSTTLAKSITTEPILDITRVLLKNWVWSGYDIGINVQLDLVNIFRDIEPNNYLPLIKFVVDGEVQLYNMYKPFFRNIDEKVIAQFLAAKDQILAFNAEVSNLYDRISIRRLKSLINQDYLVLKWRLDDTNIMNIYLFGSGYLITEFQTLAYIDATKLVDMSGIVNRVLGKIKDKYKLNLDLPALNPEKLVKTTSGSIYLASNINVLYKFVCQIKPSILASYGKTASTVFNDDKIMESVQKRLLVLPNVIVLPGSSIDKIKFIYTGTYGFYGNDNIKHYIRHYIIKKGNKLTETDKAKLFDTVQKLFNIDEKEVDLLFKELELTELEIKTGGLLFHINCKLEYDRSINSIVIYIDTASGPFIYKTILTLLDAVIKDSLFDTEFCVINAEDTSIAIIQPEPDLADFSDLDINIDMPELDIAGMDLNIDMDLVNKLQELEEENEKGRAIDAQKKADAEQEPLMDIKLKQLIGKKDKMRIVNYMKEMRRLYDPNLYEPVIKGQKSSSFMYDRGCPQTSMRQPFIVRKDQLASFDPEAITGYLKYRNNYYICPRIWDAMASKPISVKNFIANGLRSPYTPGGQSVLAGPAKNLITDKYTVIIRQPTTDEYWQDTSKHKNWPAELKRTEKDAYPGLTFSSKHPDGICVPCCHKNIPGDFDPNKKEIQQFFKPHNYQKCNYKPERDDIKQDSNTDMKAVDTFCKNDDYIGNGATSLKNKNCRLALLPEELNLLLNNAQELFTNSAETGLNDGANLFLRRGVQYNNITNILDTFASLLELKTDKLLSLITNKLSPLDFINLNNGKLVNVFARSADLPITPDENAKFTRFIQLYPKLLEYLNIDSDMISKVLDNKSHNNLSQTKLLYRICTSFYNYLGYLNSPNEVKSIEFVVELFTRPHKWLFKNGLNILIFDKSVSNIKCMDSFNYKAKQLVLLIEEEHDVFIPIVHVTNKFGKHDVHGVLELGDSFNLSTTQTSMLYKQKPTMTKLIESAKDRLNNIVKLLYIQSNLCNYNLANFYTQLNKTMRNNEMAVNKQYDGLGNSAQVEYININNTIILPVYPTRLIEAIFPADYTELHEDILEQKLNLAKYIDLLYETEKNKYNILLSHGYSINEVLLDNIQTDIPVTSNSKHPPSEQEVNGTLVSTVYICGISFDNGLVISVIPEKYIPESFAKYKSSVYKEYGLVLRTKRLITTNLLKPLQTTTSTSSSKTNTTDNTKLISESMFNLFAFIIELIKNMLSQYISRNQKSQEIQALITNLLVNQQQVYNIISELDTILSKYIIRKESITLGEYIKILVNTAGLNKGNKRQTRKQASTFCSQAQQTKKVVSQINKVGLCILDTKKNVNKLALPTDLYPVMLLAICRDLINNRLETDKIIKGKYIIPVNDLYLTRIGTSTLNIMDNFMTNLIISPDELAFYISQNIISKYKKDYKLKAPELSLLDIANIDTEQVDFLKDFIILNLSQKLTGVLGLLSVLSSISTSSKIISSKSTENIIQATVFNSDGMYNINASGGNCKFPIRDRRGAISYKCNKAKDIFKNPGPEGLKPDDLICATNVNKDKTVKSWGYCPEKPKASLARLKSDPVTDAYSPINMNQKLGSCEFPFIYYNKKVVNPLTGTKPFLQLSFNCKDNTYGTWCYTKAGQLDNKPANPANKNNTGPNKKEILLIGALDYGNIYKGVWSFGPIANNMDTGLNMTGTFLENIADTLGYKEGICTFKEDVDQIKKIESQLKLDNIKQIPSIDDYNPNYCELSEDKKGYTKQQLYLFGKNILGIPYKIMLTANNKILTKPELCALFNNKIREIKKAQFAMLDQETIDYSQIYKKDPVQCDKGETKGGYKFTELREMAITFFGLDEAKARDMDKPALCKYIIPRLSGKQDDYQQPINNNNESPDNTTYTHKYIDPDDVYPVNKNINICSKPIKRGGLSISAVKKIARTYFGIDTHNKDKRLLCDLIKDGIEQLVKTNAKYINKAKLVNKRINAPELSTIQEKGGKLLATTPASTINIEL